MTVPAQTPINRHTGNGVTTIFPFTFKVLQAGDLEVSIGGVVQSSGFTVSGVGANAGNVTFSVPPAAGAVVVLRRVMAIQRTTDYQDQGAMPASTVDDDHDATVMMVQQVAAVQSSALQYPLDEGISGVLPSAAARAGKILAFDSLGKPIPAVLLEDSSADVRLDLATTGAGKGAEMVAFKQSGAGAIERTAAEKLRESKSINDYAGDTPVQKSAAMIADLGFVRFTPGEYVFTSSTLDAPLFFEKGAYITVPSGNTLTISSRIESPRQWIFRGDGSYSLGHDGNSGEDAREVHVSWFGAFPYPGVNPVDQAPFINKAFASMGNGRESVVCFDVGNYTMRSQVTVTRGGWVKGEGTRRTVFLHDTDGFTTFVTGNVACKFSDIQFEIRTSAITNRVSPFISIQHADAEIYSVNMGQTEKGIIVNAVNVRIDDVRAVYGYALAANSNLISVQGGGQISIRNIFANSSTFGPDALVHIGQSSAATITGILVDNIDYIVPSKAVLVDAKAHNIGRLQLTNIRYNGAGGTPPANIIHFVTGSAATINDCTVSDVFVNGYADNGIRIEQNSSGVTEDLMFDNIIINGATGNGFEFVRTAGTLHDVYIGNNVDVSERATPYFYSGTTSGFRIAPNALPAVLPSYCYDFNIADDGVAQIALNRSVFTGWLMISVGTAERGIYVIRAASSPTSAVYGTPTANMNTVTTALTGTTGTDGRFTIGVTSGVLYFENRLGSSQRVTAALLTGVA